MSSVVFARVPRELREELKKYGVNISKVIRRALEEELERIRLRKAEEAAQRAKQILMRIPPGEIAKSIREDRLKR